MLLQLLRSLLIATTERPTDAGRVLLPKLAKGCDGGNCSSIWCAFSHQKVAEAGTEGKTQRSSANAASELEQPEPVALRLPTDAAKRNEELEAHGEHRRIAQSSLVGRTDRRRSHQILALIKRALIETDWSPIFAFSLAALRRRMWGRTTGRAVRRECREADG